jgi:hypothetical protein
VAATCCRPRVRNAEAGNDLRGYRLVGRSGDVAVRITTRISLIEASINGTSLQGSASSDAVPLIVSARKTIHAFRNETKFSVLPICCTSNRLRDNACTSTRNRVYRDRARLISPKGGNPLFARDLCLYFASCHRGFSTTEIFVQRFSDTKVFGHKGFQTKEPCLAFRFPFNFYRGIHIQRAEPRSKACRSK